MAKNGLSARWVNVNRLLVDPKYQRALKAKHRQYVEKWDWRAAGAILVSRRAGESVHLYVVDGFQRLEAAKSAGFSEMFCVVVDCDGVQDEAEIFIMCNVARTQMSPLDKFWAGVTAGGKLYTQTLKAARRHGFEINKTGESPPKSENGTISSVGKLMQAYERKVLDGVLAVCSEAVTSGNRKKLLSGFFLGGIEELLYRCSPVDLDRLAKKLRLSDLEAVQAHAKQIGNRYKSIGLGGGGARYFAAAICDVYNKGLSNGKKLQYEVKNDKAAA